MRYLKKVFYMAFSIKTVAVFCGSRFGNSPLYRQQAEKLGHMLAKAGLQIVYGGGYVGLMGTMANAAIEAHGTVIGVIPEFLKNREVMHEGVKDLTVTTSMHDRKFKMFSQADAFLVLPGGLGTYDEAIEIITWRQLGLHDKPIIIINTLDWARQFADMVQTCIDTGFAEASVLNLFDIVPDVQTALEKLNIAVTAHLDP